MHRTLARRFPPALIAAALLALSLCPGRAHAATPPPQASQAQSGAAVAGTVTDSTGAAIPGAEVVIRMANGVSKTAVTDGAGKYSITGLPNGTASIKISNKGFSDYVSEGLNLSPGEPLPIDAQLSAAATGDTVTVKGNVAPLVETQNAEVSGTLSAQEVVSFGLNGRNFTSLLTLAPGVSNQTNQDEAKVGALGSAKFSVNGGRTEYNTFNVDGMDVLNTDIAAAHGHTTLLVYPSVDSISELKVLTSNYGAEYGRSASGTVLLSVKSGTDSLHGNLYEFFRNEFFNARNYFDPPGHAPLYRRNDFGATLGGPLTIKNFYHPAVRKTYFFVSEEVRKEKTPFEFNQGVPSDAERGFNLLTGTYGNVADFSDVCPVSVGATVPFNAAAYPDCPGHGSGGTRQTFTNNQFYIDPNAQVILSQNFIPRANAVTGCTSSIGSCYVAAIPQDTDYRQDLGRLDQTITTNTKASVTFVHDHWTTTTAIPWWTNNTNSFPSVENNMLGPGWALVGHLTTAFTPTLLNDFSLSGTFQRIILTNFAGPGVDLSRGALLNTPDPFGSFFGACPGGNCELPGLIFGGNNAEYGGNGFTIDTSYTPWYSSRAIATLTDNVSKYVGRHTFQFGVQVTDARRHEQSSQNGANSGNTNGQLYFRNTSNYRTSGNAFADFLYNNESLSYDPLGGGQNLFSFTQDNAHAIYSVKYWVVEPYFQDDYKVTSRLTVNLGIRLSLFGNWQRGQSDPVWNWDPAKFDPTLFASTGYSINVLSGYIQQPDGSPLPPNYTNLNPVLINGLVQCGANRVPDSCATSHILNPAPRVGFAWDPTGKGQTSIRGGYGIFWEHGTGSEANIGSLMANPPQILSETQQYPDNFSSIGQINTGPGISFPIQEPFNLMSIPDKTVWPYVQQWSFGLQQEVNNTTALSLAYVGSRGTHLAVGEQLNQLPPVPASENPFPHGQPITSDICLNSEADVNDLTNPFGYFYLPFNNTFLYQGQNPNAYLGLVAACNGSQGLNGHPSIAFDQNFIRPFKGLGQIRGIRNIASSHYNSMQFTLHHTHGIAPDNGFTRDMLQPIDFSLSYTYSHSIDDASDRFSSTFVNAYDLQANKASSDFDQRHLLNSSYIFALPFNSLARSFINTYNNKPDSPPAAKAVAAPGPAKPDDRDLKPLYPNWVQTVLSNWQLTGITTYYTGTPFSVINNGGRAVCPDTPLKGPIGTGAISSCVDSTGMGVEPYTVSVLDNAGLALNDGADSYPDLARGPLPCSAQRGSIFGTFGPQLRNPCRYVAPTGLTQGDAGRNSENNPHRINWDMALIRNFKTWGSTNLQFRWEVFNVFNNTQFILYDATKGNTAANEVSCYGGGGAGFSAGASQCAASNGLLRPIEAHRPRTMQLGLKFEY